MINQLCKPPITFYSISSQSTFGLEVIMPKHHLNIQHYYLLKASIITLLGLLGQSALAACPDALSINIQDKVVGSFNGKTIYFCKQNFPNNALIFKPTNAQLLPGGNQVIPRGSTIQTQPLSNSVNLAGFNVANLAFNTLLANYPNQDGQFGSPSLFNFYTRIGRRGDCTSQYQLMRDFLRAKPNTFQLIPQSGSNSSQTTGNDLVKITDAKLNSAIDPTKTLTADIYLYHTNANLSGQFFTDNSFFGGYRDCWVGVGSRVVFDPNNGSLKYAGDYKLEIDVNIQ